MTRCPMQARNNEIEQDLKELRASYINDTMEYISELAPRLSTKQLEEIEDYLEKTVPHNIWGWNTGGEDVSPTTQALV